MTLPSWMFSPAWWIAFWCFVAAGVLVLLYFSISNALREIEEAEDELAANEHMNHVGSNIWVIWPDFHDEHDSTDK